jgi:hypothetical protein
MLENYLIYLNEGKILNWMRDIGLTIKDLYIEPGQCKRNRMNNSIIYLFHGTRPHYVSDIKRKGLLVSMANKRSMEDNDVNLSGTQPVIWFSSTYNPNNPEFGGIDKKIVMTVVKLETKYLKNFLGTTYKYYKDVPPKDIIWENEPSFIKIANQSMCLKVKK